MLALDNCTTKSVVEQPIFAPNYLGNGCCFVMTTALGPSTVIEP